MPRHSRCSSETPVDAPATNGYSHDVQNPPLRGSGVAHLTCPRELRLSTGDLTRDEFEVKLAGLPPTLRRLRITHVGKCEHAFPSLEIVAPPAVPPAQGAAGEPNPPDPARARSQAGRSQPAVPAAPELVSFVIDCRSTQLPASLPLPASCAVTIHAALLTLTQVGKLPAHARRDYQK